VAVERQRSVHVPVAVRNEASHLQLAKDTCNDTDMAFDNAEQRSVDVPLSTGNLSSTAKVNITRSHCRHLTDNCMLVLTTLFYFTLYTNAVYALFQMTFIVLFALISTLVTTTIRGPTNNFPNHFPNPFPDPFIDTVFIR